MKTKLVVEVVAPIDVIKEFKEYDSLDVNPERTASVSVKVGTRYGTAKISRDYHWKKAKPKYNIDYSGNFGSPRRADGSPITSTGITFNDSALIAEYERARAVAQTEYDLQQDRKKMDSWLNHPVRAFQTFADTTNHKFVLDPTFTMNNFLKDKDHDAKSRIEVVYGSKKWQYRVGYDKYRSDNSGKTGKLTLRAIGAKGDENSYEESRFDHKVKYSKKPGEIIRYMEEDIENMKNRLDEKIKEEAEEMARIAQINKQWKVEGGQLEEIEDDGFSVVMDKKKCSKHSYHTTAKKVDVKINEGKTPTYEISGIEAKFTKAQVEAIIEIVKKAQVTTY